MFNDAPNYLKTLWYVFGFALLALAIWPVTFTPTPWVAVLCIVLWSLALSIKTAKENYGHDCHLYRVVSGWGERWALWYDGGNAIYNPAYPWTMDMWHLLRDLMVYAFAFAMIAGTGTTVWIVLPFIENIVFMSKSTYFKTGRFPIGELVTEFFKTANKFTNT
jgi:hypothetical protein